MGESRRRLKKGSLPKDKKTLSNASSRIVSWFPVTKAQRDGFIQLSIRGAWVGIVLLVLLWVVVRFIGPSVGWWTLADMR